MNDALTPPRAAVPPITSDLGYDFVVEAVQKYRPSNVLRRLTRPQESQALRVENGPVHAENVEHPGPQQPEVIAQQDQQAPREENPNATVTTAVLTVGAVGLGLYLLHEFFSQSVSVSPQVLLPTPIARVPIPTPVTPTIRLGVTVADGRAHFSSFDTGPTRAIVSASGRSVTLVASTLPIQIKVSVSENTEPVTEVAVDHGAEVHAESGGHDLSFIVSSHSVSMELPSVELKVQHQVDQNYLSEDQLKIFVLHP